MMDNYKLKLEINQGLSTGKVIKRTIAVQSENDNLVDCIKSVVGKDCLVAFQHYYSNTDLMNFEKILPYILSDGTIKWYVPYTEVTIKDFRETHSLRPDDVIYAETDNVGSGWGDISEIISWISNNWETIEHFAELKSIGVFIHKVYKWFSNKKRVARFEDVEEAIEHQDCWVSNKLMKIFKVDDPELMDCILYSMGYERIENEYKPRLMDSDTESNVDIWGKTTCHHWTRDLTNDIQQLNLLLTDLKYRSENLELKCFGKVKNNINRLLQRWHEYIKQGDTFCFIQLINPPAIYDYRELKADIRNMYSYVRSFLDIVAELEEEDIAAQPNEIKWPKYKKPKKDDFYEESEEYEECIVPYEMLLTELFLKDIPLTIITDSGTITAYVEQIYDEDILLQVLSEEGIFIGHKTINTYDIKVIRTDTKFLRFISNNVPASCLPSLPSYGSSAVEYLLEYACDNNKPIAVVIENAQIPQITAKVIEIEDGADPSVTQLVKLQLFDDEKEKDGMAWVEMESMQSVQVMINNSL